MIFLYLKIRKRNWQNGKMIVWFSLSVTVICIQIGIICIVDVAKIIQCTVIITYSVDLDFKQLLFIFK